MSILVVHTGAGLLISEDAAQEVQSSLVKYWPYPQGTPPLDREMAKGIFIKRSLREEVGAHCSYLSTNFLRLV